MQILSILTVLLVSAAELTSAVPAPALKETRLDDGTFIVTGLAKRAQANAVTGIRKGYSGSYRVVRQEINTFITDKGGVTFNLFLLALQVLQNKNKGDWKSWWEICGIHARPYHGWNGEGATGNPNTGYCTHASTLFPTWHRPYLALMEQNIWNAAEYVVKSIPKTKSAAFKKQWMDSLQRIRLPYWDWASNNAQMPWVLTQEWITITKPNGGKEKIRNPLYAANFKSGTYNDQSLFPNDPFFRWSQTKRAPANTDTNVPSRNDVVQQSLAGNADGLRQNVYHLLVDSQYSKWNAFSNKGANQPGTSIEAIHDIIHGITGSGGHMTYIDYSSFDPIFWLHHCNIDRIFAMWQAVHGSSYVTGQNNPFGTYGVRANTYEDAGTPLTPFRDYSGRLLTSWTVRDTGYFGYGYADTPKWSFYKNPKGYVAFVKKRINQLYGSTNRALASAAKVKRDLAVDPGNSTAVGIDKSVKNHQYHDWKVDVIADKMALGSTYAVHVFLGTPSPNPAEWKTQKELVGDFVVLTSFSGTLPGGLDPDTVDTRVSGSVYLTQSLVDAFKDTGLESLQPADVTDFLKQNLHWTVSLSNDTSSSFAVQDVKGLELTVAAAVVTVPDDDEDGTVFPEYGDYEAYPDIVGSIGKAGDPTSSDVVASSTATSSAKASSTTVATSATTSAAAITTSAAASSTTPVVASSADVVPTETGKNVLPTEPAKKASS